MEVSEKLLKAMLSVTWVTKNNRLLDNAEYYLVETEYNQDYITKEEYDEFKRLEEAFK